MLMRNDDYYEEDELAQAHVFGDMDTEYHGLRYEELIRRDSDRGRIRIINGATHYVITRECTLSADTGWRE